MCNLIQIFKLLEGMTPKSNLLLLIRWSRLQILQKSLKFWFLIQTFKLLEGMTPNSKFLCLIFWSRLQILQKSLKFWFLIQICKFIEGMTPKSKLLLLIFWSGWLWLADSWLCISSLGSSWLQVWDCTRSRPKSPATQALHNPLFLANVFGQCSGHP